jgi:hypothetical protein
MRISRAVTTLLDLALVPLLYPAAIVMRLVRRIGVQRLPMCKSALMHVGVFPIRKHYYEPQFDFRELREPLSTPRKLAGVDWNRSEQLQLLRRLDYREELLSLPKRVIGGKTFRIDNGSFEAGDAEFWYGIIRLKKPRTIIEVGCGQSTLVAVHAIAANTQEDASYECNHICIEPYEAPWLESVGVNVIRSKVEDIALSLFSQLDINDILFVDSSHIIRPQGDVLFELLELIPTLRPGVIVHIHDIFSPRDYTRSVLSDHVFFWNEQYLLEAFLTLNHEWRVIAALNLLHHEHQDLMREKFPHLKASNEPGSFYMQRRC